LGLAPATEMGRLFQHNPTNTGHEKRDYLEMDLLAWSVQAKGQQSWAMDDEGPSQVSPRPRPSIRRLSHVSVGKHGGPYL
jgi:hypothetical protein